MSNSHWLEDLQSLIERFNSYGIEADVASLSLIEMWASYLHLTRLAEGLSNGCQSLI